MQQTKIVNLDLHRFNSMQSRYRERDELASRRMADSAFGAAPAGGQAATLRSASSRRGRLRRPPSELVVDDTFSRQHSETYIVASSCAPAARARVSSLFVNLLSSRFRHLQPGYLDMIRLKLEMATGV